jgi:hypothetical protein
MPTRTKHYSSVIEASDAKAIYLQLKKGIPWKDGIYSARARRVSRKAHMMEGNGSEEETLIEELVASVMSALELDYNILGIYVNYYRDGNDWAPSHAHAGCVQLVISLGTTRVLKVGTKAYNMASGDVILFGGSTHELLRDPSIKRGRISIATFMEPLS